MAIKFLPLSILQSKNLSSAIVYFNNKKHPFLLEELPFSNLIDNTTTLPNNDDNHVYFLFLYRYKIILLFRNLIKMNLQLEY